MIPSQQQAQQAEQAQQAQQSQPVQQPVQQRQLYNNIGNMNNLNTNSQQMYQQQQLRNQSNNNTHSMNQSPFMSKQQFPPKQSQNIPPSQNMSPHMYQKNQSPNPYSPQQPQKLQPLHHQQIQHQQNPIQQQQNQLRSQSPQFNNNNSQLTPSRQDSHRSHRSNNSLQNSNPNIYNSPNSSYRSQTSPERSRKNYNPNYQYQQAPIQQQQQQQQQQRQQSQNRISSPNTPLQHTPQQNYQIKINSLASPSKPLQSHSPNTTPIIPRNNNNHRHSNNNGSKHLQRNPSSASSTASHKTSWKELIPPLGSTPAEIADKEPEKIFSKSPILNNQHNQQFNNKNSLQIKSSSSTNQREVSANYTRIPYGSSSDSLTPVQNDFLNSIRSPYTLIHDQQQGSRLSSIPDIANVSQDSPNMNLNDTIDINNTMSTTNTTTATTTTTNTSPNNKTKTSNLRHQQINGESKNENISSTAQDMSGLTINPNKANQIALNNNNNSSNTINNPSNAKSVNKDENNNNSQLIVKKQPKICGKCGKQIIGTLVRAMDSIYHIECFTCYDCGKGCSNKFFATDIPLDKDSENKDEDNHPVGTVQVPLCEYDYFKRIDLICATCDKAIRGSYITAIGRKYHPEHFFCEVCHKLFEQEDYYEYNDSIYCHFHYSQLYAAHCESCHSAILKQYVEMYRGGREQQWHPECFMVHKFWGISITSDCIGLNYDKKSIENYEQISPDQLFEVEKKLERTIMTIWLSLSEFEESCASCISEMLHSASTGNKLNGLLITGKLVLKIECLFKSIDTLNEFASSARINLDYSLTPKLRPLNKEPRSMSSKLMSYLSFLRDTDKQKLRSSKYSQELLTLISNLAHYLKLISRNTLCHAIEYNRYTKSTIATDRYLRELSSHDSIPDNIFPTLNLSPNAKDLCNKCGESIEQECCKFEDKRFHFKCLSCSSCGKDLSDPSLISEIAYNSKTNSVLCASCSSNDVDAKTGFKRVSSYLQLIYLLKIALKRSKLSMQKKGTIGKSVDMQKITLLNGDTKDQIGNISNKQLNSLTSSNTNGHDPRTNANAYSDDDADPQYNESVSDIKRMRSMRQNERMHLVPTSQDVRRSVILEAPEAASAGTETINVDGLSSDTKSVTLGREGSKRLRVEDVPSNSRRNISSAITPNNRDPKSRYNNLKNLRANNNDRADNLNYTSNLLKNEKGLTLDDIPRIVSSEQAREHRPNAFKYQKRKIETVSSTIPETKPISSKVIDGTPNTRAPSVYTETGSLRKNIKRFSELTPTEHIVINHICIVALSKLLEGKYTPEECLNFINVRKGQTFWGKIFGSNNNSNNISDTGAQIENPRKNSDGMTPVFGTPLETLTAKYGVLSDLGIGPQKLRIPTLVDELINVMHTMDLSVEGVFRINGNIRRLKALCEEIDTHPNKLPDLNKETPIQLAALLKKLIREIPNPLLTYKLYDLFILSQEYTDDRKRLRILHLAYSLLPKVYRDLAEVLLYFFSWVASFSQIDEETGSKMDIHNLATVLAPNILYKLPAQKAGNGPSSIEVAQSENSFLAIEVVNTLIESHDEFSIIPQDIWEFYENGKFNEIESGFTTKELITKCNAYLSSNPNCFKYE
ncbi:hypothetical protein B5S28_g4029 [[Candida] boidinii]|nr:hypothetical protein B5S28_g4029 [[Candida] boidinii]OWB80064.1 hypothetical protein B5S32_g4312 [[Candida] boidinii]